MIRSIVESEYGKLSDHEFWAICDMADKDIKVNRLSFGRRTNMNYLLFALKTCAGIVKKI
jgi:hypothetical protein